MNGVFAYTGGAIKKIKFDGLRLTNVDVELGDV